MFRQKCHPTLVLTAGWLLAGVNPGLFAHDGLDARVARLDAAISGQPLDPELFEQRAELHRLHEHSELAWADLRQARRLAQDGAMGRLIEARLARDLGWLHAARRAAKSYVAEHPGDGSGHVLHAELLASLGRSAEALAAYQRALSVLPSPGPDVYLAAAATLEGQGDAGRVVALSLIEAGIERLGHQVVLVLEAVSLENSLARVDAALARLDTLVRSSDRPERWLAARGDVLLEAGRHLEAEVAYTAALDAVRGGARRRAHTAAAARLKLHIAERLAAGAERSSRKR